MKVLRSAILSCTALAWSASAVSTHNTQQASFSTSDTGSSDVSRVPVVLGVMSRCPDALFCENIFDDVVETAGIWNKVNLSLSFIGRLNESEPDYGVTCMHGREECRGNVQQLCAAKYSSQEQWWKFVQCQNLEGKPHVGEPELAKRCANDAGIDWEKLWHRKMYWKQWGGQGS